MENDILDDRFIGNSFGDIEPIRANQGRRFANLLVDTVVFYLTIYILSFSFGYFLPEIANALYRNMDGYPILSQLADTFLYFSFFLLLELSLKGRTIGKFFTKTKTVMKDGTELTSIAVLKKSASRIVPFDALSFLGSGKSGWHDKWSDTAVVDLNKYQALQRRDSFETTTSYQNYSLAER